MCDTDALWLQSICDAGSDVVCLEGVGGVSRSRAEGRQVVAERITVGLMPKVADDLERMQLSSGLSKTDLVNRAISLAAFMDRQFTAGNELLIRDGKTGELGILHVL